MFAQLFSKYLVDQNVITDVQREDILEKMSSTRAKMGTIAVAEKMLTEEQADELNQLQTQVDKRFGDLAVEKGYLTDDDIATLLKKQGSPYILFIQLAEELANIPLSEVETHLAQFQKVQGWSDEEMEALKKDDIDYLLPVIAPCSNSIVSDLTGLALRCIVRFVTTNYYVGRLKKASELAYDKLAGQFLLGAHKLFVGFASEKDSNGLSIMAGKYAKETFEDDNDEIYDAIGEFTNCLNGLFAIDMGNKEIDVDMEPPVAYKNSTLTGSFYVMPVYIEDRLVNLVISADTDINMGSDELKLDIGKREGVQPVADGKETVLIVDDSKMSRKVLRDILEKQGYQIVGEAVDGVEGVNEYNRLKPDIVTMDVTMPNMDGILALSKIIENDPNAKVVMISAAGQQKRIIEAIKIGAKKFITKPFDQEDIIKNLSDL